ncbi:MAG: CapA family protein [Lachnospiraceae bacterium]|nr:CapA family protein [Lachnospiraceae bacterium]
MKKRIRLFAGLAVLAAAGMLNWSGIQGQAAAAESAETLAGRIAVSEPATLGDDAVTVTKISISAVGDCTLGNDPAQESRGNAFHKVYNANGPDYFLQYCRPVFYTDDITIANLEGVLTTMGTAQQKAWRFRSDPSYIEILTHSSVDVVAFANNHCRDFGEISYTDTMKNLEAYGLPYSSEDNVCVMEVNGVRVGIASLKLLGDNAGYFKQRIQTKVDELKAENVQLILLNCHWGIELDRVPNHVQTELGHFAIDAGVDLVIGHHPHVLQSVECYNGKYIIYSLGNFCFGGNTNPKNKDTMIWRQDFIFTNGQLSASEARVLPYSISSRKDLNDYCPVPLNGADYDRVIRQLNDLSAAYHVQFDEKGNVVPQ